MRGHDDLWERDPAERRRLYTEWVQTRPGPNPDDQLIEWPSIDHREAYHRFVAESAIRHLGASTPGDGETFEARARLDLSLVELHLVGATRQLDAAAADARRLLRATWVLAAATAALVAATVILAVLTAGG